MCLIISVLLVKLDFGSVTVTRVFFFFFVSACFLLQCYVREMHVSVALKRGKALLVYGCVIYDLSSYLKLIFMVGHKFAICFVSPTLTLVTLCWST